MTGRITPIKSMVINNETRVTCKNAPETPFKKGKSLSKADINQT